MESGGCSTLRLGTRIRVQGSIMNISVIIKRLVNVCETIDCLGNFETERKRHYVLCVI